MAAPRSALRRDARRPFVVACAMWMSASGRIATVADRPIAAVGTALHSSHSSMLVGQLQTYTECKENPHRGLDRHKRAARFACRQQRPRYVTPRLRLRAMDRARTGLAALGCCAGSAFSVGCTFGACHDSQRALKVRETNETRMASR